LGTTVGIDVLNVAPLAKSLSFAAIFDPSALNKDAGEQLTGWNTKPEASQRRQSGIDT
jgi:hypothetical protein